VRLGRTKGRFVRRRRRRNSVHPPNLTLARRRQGLRHAAGIFTSESDSEYDEPDRTPQHAPARTPRRNGETQTLWLPVDPAAAAAAAADAAAADAAAYPTPRSFIRFAAELRREVTIPERYRRRPTAEDGPGGAARDAVRGGESAGILGPWSFGTERPDSRPVGDAAAAGEHAVGEPV
jgi:hypothetical protein